MSPSDTIPLAGTGPARAGRLILPHEHVFCRIRSTYLPFANDFLRRELESAAQLGVTGIVDLTTYVSPKPFAETIRQSGVTVYRCEGFYLERRVRKDLRQQSPAKLAEILLRRVQRTPRGMPVVALKIATSGERFTAFETRALTSVAMVSHRTSLPIVTHAVRGGEAQLRYLMQLGITPNSVIISHPEMGFKGKGALSFDETIAMCKRILALGANICLTDFYPSTSVAARKTVQLAVDLVQSGYENQVMVSSDQSWSYRGGIVRFQGGTGRELAGYSMSATFTLPAMAEGGVDADSLARIFLDNPLRLLRIP